MDPSKIAGAAKAGATKAAAGKVLAVGSVAAFAGRRALWPGFVVGGAFAAAAWFGTFELTWSATKVLLPIPAEPNAAARAAGVASIPVSSGSVLWVGHRFAPAVAPPPASIVDLSGLAGFVRSLPLKHYALTGLSSAGAAAVCCRVVQSKGGA